MAGCWKSTKCTINQLEEEKLTLAKYQILSIQMQEQCNLGTITRRTYKCSKIETLAVNRVT